MERISKLSISQTGEYVLVPIEIWNEAQKGEEKEKTPVCSNMGDLIQLYRNFKFLSKKALAAQTGLVPCQISNFENNKKTPRIETVTKLAKVLGTEFYTKAIEITRKAKAM